MRSRRPFKVDKKQSTNKSDTRSVSDIVKELKQGGPPVSNYRTQSLKVNGLICAKCGREFEDRDRHLLTVHHKDGNHQHNPTDGSNWENLCVYCHEDEHSRGILGDYINSEGNK